MRRRRAMNAQAANIKKNTVKKRKAIWVVKKKINRKPTPVKENTNRLDRKKMKWVIKKKTKNNTAMVKQKMSITDHHQAAPEARKRHFQQKKEMATGMAIFVVGSGVAQKIHIQGNKIFTTVARYLSQEVSSDRSSININWSVLTNIFFVSQARNVGCDKRAVGIKNPLTVEVESPQQLATVVNKIEWAPLIPPGRNLGPTKAKVIPQVLRYFRSELGFFRSELGPFISGPFEIKVWTLETQIEMTYEIVKETCGRNFDQSGTLNADGTRGGVLVAWSTHKFEIKDLVLRQYTISILLQFTNSTDKFWYTGVYRPSVRSHRNQFFQELKDIKPQNGEPWILCDDFNVATRFLKKDKLELKELKDIKPQIEEDQLDLQHYSQT